MDWAIGKKQQHISGRGPRKIARRTIMLYTSVLDRMERSWIMYGRVRRKIPDKLKDHQGRKGDVISCLYVHP